MGKYSKASRLEAGDPGKTVQADARETNINEIMKKAYQQGCLPPSRLEPMYGDFSTITSYQDAVIRVQNAKEAFQTLPADVRLRFGNRPEQLLEFLEDPKNLPEAIELGLVEKVKPKAPEGPKKEEIKPVEKPAEKGAA